MKDYTKFLTVEFKKKEDLHDRHQETTFGFLIPGVNSGAYTPTLYIRVRIEEWIAGFFRTLSPKVSTASITLNDQQFDDLFLEMQKIKKLRDCLRELAKENSQNKTYEH